MASRGLNYVEKGIKITDFLPEGSYVGVYFAKRDFYFGEIDTIEIITTAQIDPSSTDDRTKLISTIDNVAGLNFTVGWSNCWYENWESWHASTYLSTLDSTTSTSDARASFDAWLATDEAKIKYRNNIIIDSGGLISTSKLSILFLFSTMDTDKAVVEMYEAR